ncbi:ribonuclease H-like domain-containing protein [Tanacetum coccineum]
MITRSKVKIVKANPKYNLHVTTSSHISKSPFHALRDPNWKQAMCDEYKALIDNNTWVLVPRPPNVNIVRSMWLYKHKYNADGSLNRYKARLVANGHSQQQGIDCDEIFSPVVKPATIQTVLSDPMRESWIMDCQHGKYGCQRVSGVTLSESKGLSSRVWVDGILPGLQLNSRRSLDLKGSPDTDPNFISLSLQDHFSTFTFTRPDLSLRFKVMSLHASIHRRGPHLSFYAKRCSSFSLREPIDIGINCYFGYYIHTLIAYLMLTGSVEAVSMLGVANAVAETSCD